MTKLSDMMRGLGDLQSLMDGMGDKIQEQMKSLKVEGVAGGGMVRVVLVGDFSVETVEIDDALFADGGAIIADLVKAAMNEALGKLRQEMKDKALGGLPLPEGFKPPF